MCRAMGKTTIATVADHIKDHKGDLTLFWEGKLQSLCKPHHDGAKQRETHIGYSGACGPDGWPTDARHPANATK